ncbi:trifunctional nucleotide phosphoesterase protein YfkN isoform X1 [Stomoxys calcitrans]|uniref:5'-Nucleotidase C-terminal domain-containing protein n=2 Tax=Stomoxys calcitrans TaxID=35570 RepID=A0A1I8PAL9_STOCA|nr:trifunctional nucleotide phosphoesterase protein YfkN isoform X1 [Stomoxys calcitrans]
MKKLLFFIMADISSQSSQLRTKLGDIVEHNSTTALNEATEVTKGLRNVVGWLKQASIEVREAGKRAVTQIQSSNPNFLSNEFDLDDPDLLSPTSSTAAAANAADASAITDETKYETKSLSHQDLSRSSRPSLSQPQSPRARGRVDNFTAGYHRSTSIITQLEKSKILLKMSDQDKKPLTILHYNDVYNVDVTTEVEPIGGAARFCTAIRTFESDNPLVLFSGDIFSPSMLSTFTQGEQMVPVLNAIGTHCAVFGNHDFDHGLDVLVELIKKTSFPWLMSNVVDNETGRPLGGGKISHYIFHNQISIGLIGLVEKEWLETLPTIDPKEVTYIDYVEAGNKLAAELRNEGCELIIALTHMRTPNDINLAQHCSGIDLILGGHDHVYEIKEVNGIKIIKSGTDFRQFSKITIQKERDENGKIKIDIEAIDVTAKYAENEELKTELAKYSEVIEAKMTEVLGNFSVELDGRFSAIRTQETNLGDWVCDVVLAATGADVALINSGTFRSDQIHPPGPFTMRDLVNIIPMRDPLILLEISGKCLYEALENAVSGYPKLEGRFPQVSGVAFAFDPSKPPGKRIDPQLVQVGDEYLNMEQNYKICIKNYIYNGCDGFTMFKDAKVLMDDDSCPELGLTVQNHFKAINLRTGKGGHHTKHRQSLVTLSRRHSMVQMLDNLELDGPSPIRKLSGHQTKSIDLSNTNCSKMLRRASLDDLEQASCQLAPKIQHRIIRIQNEEHYNQLLLKKETSIKNTTITEAEDE